MSDLLEHYEFHKGSINNWSLTQLIEAANYIVIQGDSFGTKAKHPTTIKTRQILERLAKELKGKLNETECNS